MTAKPVLQHSYVVHRMRAEQGDLQALLSFVSMIQNDLSSLGNFGNLPSSLAPLVKSLASEAEQVKNYVWGFRDGRDFGQIEQARALSPKRKRKVKA